MLLLGIIIVFLFLVVESRKSDQRAEAFAEMEHAKMVLGENNGDADAYAEYERWRQVYVRANGITPLSKIKHHVESEEAD